MTALELADFLASGPLQEWNQVVATIAMLRSQHSDIERLKAEIVVWRDEDRHKMITITNLRDLCEAYVSTIATLRAENQRLASELAAIKAQPVVAWILTHPDGLYSNDILPEWRIEQVRRDSGQWTRLIVAPKGDVCQN